MNQKGSAGPRGSTVRSDAHVELWLREQGGLELQLHSKVMALFGAKIEARVRAVLRDLGVEHARLELHDQGALDWVLAARIEAAARRAGVDPARRSLPPQRHDDRPHSPRDRLRRSRLYLPGNGPKLMINAGLYGADGLILDLEDSVAPERKDAARLLVRNALRQLDFGEAERMVRINQGELGLRDLSELADQKIDLLLLPKIESAEEVQAVEAHLRSLRGDDHGLWLMPIIESARGALNAYAIASASPAVVALAMGLEDYTANIGVPRTQDGRESSWARGQVVNAARAAGVQPIDTVYSDVANMQGLRASVQEAKALGFDGKGCIHPRQIAVVHQAFAPGDDEIERAARIVRAFDRAQAQGLGVVSLGSKMIDPPVVKRAQRVVELALNLRMLPPDWREGAIGELT